MEDNDIPFFMGLMALCLIIVVIVFSLIARYARENSSRREPAEKPRVTEKA